MVNVIFVGDSFSDDGRNMDIFDLKLLKNTFNYYTMGFPNTLKFSNLLGLEIFNQGKKDVKIHTLGRGSYGNHVITKILKDKVLEIRTKNPDEKIYAIIQLSAFVRNGLNINITNLDVKDFPYDYFEGDLSYQKMSSVFEKHLDNIEDIHNFCVEQNVDNYMYFGWSVLFDSDFKFYNCEGRKDKIKQIVNFFKYDECYDEMSMYCSGNKPKTKQTDNNEKLYLVHGGNFGGHTEYARAKLNVGERYFMRHDPHLSSKSYLVFYYDILRNWFLEKNIIDNVDFSDDIKQRINSGLQWEQMKYNLLTNSNHLNSGVIRDLCFTLFRGDQIDLKYCEKKFIELNKELTNKNLV